MEDQLLLNKSLRSWPESIGLCGPESGVGALVRGADSVGSSARHRRSHRETNEQQAIPTTEMIPLYSPIAVSETGSPAVISGPMISISFTRLDVIIAPQAAGRMGRSD